jgi:hypothetical protein
MASPKVFSAKGISKFEMPFFLCLFLYGKGDKFLEISVPQTKGSINKYQNISLIEKTVTSK